jgi:hypothetical protein
VWIDAALHHYRVPIAFGRLRQKRPLDVVIAHLGRAHFIASPTINALAKSDVVFVRIYETDFRFAVAHPLCAARLHPLSRELTLHYGVGYRINDPNVVRVLLRTAWLSGTGLLRSRLRAHKSAPERLRR